MAASEGTNPKQDGGKSGILQNIIGLGVVTLLSVFAGFGLSLYSQGTMAKPEEKMQACSPEERRQAQMSDHVSVVRQIPSILTNLAGNGAPWLRLDLSVVLPKDIPEQERLLAELAQDFLGFVRTLETAQVTGGVGLELLRDDLREIAKVRTQGTSVDVLVRSFIIQ